MSSDTDTEKHSRLINTELKNILYDSNVVLTDKQRDMLHSYCYSPNTLSVTDYSEKDKMAIVDLVDKAIRHLYSQVSRLVSQYQPNLQQHQQQDDMFRETTAQMLTSSVQQLCIKIQNSQIGLIEKKMAVSKELTNYVKVILELLDVIWLIIQEFKYGFEKEKNQTLDTYLDTMADHLLLRIKQLHLSVMTATYDEKLTVSLQSLRRLLDERLTAANNELASANDRLQNYHHLGPMFEKLRKTYSEVLQHIKATEDDIQRMKPL